MLRIRVVARAVSALVCDVRAGTSTAEWDPAEDQRVEVLMDGYADLAHDFA